MGPSCPLVRRTMKHAKECKAVGSLLVPMWKSAYFWPLLSPDGCHLAPFVHQCMFITFHDDLILKSGGNLSESLTLDSIVMCLWLDFTIPPRENSAGFCT